MSISSCLPCGKSFPQKHNLTNHLNTISHRNTIKTMEIEDGCVGKQKRDLDEEYELSTDDIMNVEVEESTIIYSSGNEKEEVYQEVDEIDQTEKVEEYENDEGQVMQVIYI